jgi:hypothetical protein
MTNEEVMRKANLLLRSGFPMETLVAGLDDETLSALAGATVKERERRMLADFARAHTEGLLLCSSASGLYYYHKVKSYKKLDAAGNSIVLAVCGKAPLRTYLRIAGPPIREHDNTQERFVRTLQPSQEVTCKRCRSLLGLPVLV